MERLMKADFDEQYDRLVKWHRVRMTREQAAMTYEKLQWMPIAALRYAVEWDLENTRPTPGMFPIAKDILAKCWEWLDGHPGEKFRRTKFDPIKDDNYPLYKLWEGFEKLEKYGEKVFSQWADANRMPRTDRERVLMKLKVVNARRSGEFDGKLKGVVASVGELVNRKPQEPRGGNNG